uniref:Uncharacterized protein n=1 Tax=Oryza punctata TaxID=4537 RepID=A0A0E0JLA2_ORYPU
MAERQVAELGAGAACVGWNHCGRRLAAGAVDGFVSVYDSQPSPSSKWQAHEHAILNIVWLPPDYGDAIACVCADGTLSLWEEISEDDQLPTWRKCKVFESGNSHILNVTAYSDGQVKVYELLDSLELDKWQLQIWEFEEAHQRWLPLVELGSPQDKGDIVRAVAWAPNIGRPYEIIAVATCKGIAIWHIGLSAESDGSLSTENVAVLSGHDGEVLQLEWDMGGMTLASTGGDGMVKLWQANLNGVWHEQAVLDCNVSH